jgi:hypothetical protein
MVNAFQEAQKAMESLDFAAMFSKVPNCHPHLTCQVDFFDRYPSYLQVASEAVTLNELHVLCGAIGKPPSFVH